MIAREIDPALLMPTSRTMHLSDWFQRHAVTRPTALAISTPKLRLTYAEFYRAVNIVGPRLADSGIRAGETVGLCIRNPALHAVLIVALNRMGSVVLSLRRPTHAEEEIALPYGVQADRVLVEQPFEGAPYPGALHVDLDWIKNKKTDVAEWTGPGFPDADAIAYILTSSGTTGESKAFGLSSRKVETRVLRSSVGRLATARTGKMLCQFGFRTAAGFRIMLTNFWSGGTVFTGWPENTAPGLIGRHRIERLDGSPAHYEAILRTGDPAAFDLSSLQCAFIGGSITPSRLIAAIRSKICRDLMVLYGASEVGSIAFGALRADEPPGRCGYLVPWIGAQVVDENGREVPVGTEGNLRFRCDEMTESYLGDSRTSASHFKDGWFYPGDLGTIDARRSLFVSGRSSERINAGGVKVSPAVVERVVSEYDGIADCAAFGVPDEMGVEQIWAAIVVRKEIDMKALKKYCAPRLGQNAPRNFLTLPELPRNETGKILRTMLPKLAADSKKSSGK